ncbi:unnamed protein product [Rotaria sordida]|uniref:G-protein coupled receptors family 1 profile domain-containing protein n=1 Tax=Rotaria sordida TaxID=392033 RepID=A0A818JH86_9BILA|nr:unnamed protein product [Rotaria sordida]CAF3539413.1 unnamed protein product [Rotaria sordida]
MNTTVENIDYKYYIIKRSVPDSFGTQLTHVCRLFRFYSSVILVIVGMIGSLLSIKVFSSTKIRRNSSNEYLITMSFVVALLLFNFFCDEVLRSLVYDFHVDLPLNLVDLSKPLCKCSTYFRHTLRFAANWIVVAFTLERLIVVYFPLQTSVLCNPRSARRICLFILIISFLLPIYSFLMSDISNVGKTHVFECDIMDKYKTIYVYLTIIYGNLTLTFPILIVCIVNILTVRQLLHAGRLRKKQQQLSQTKKVDSANNEYVNMILKNQLENDKVTWMLVVISITFGILNFPYFIFWLVVCIMRVRGQTPSAYIISGKMIAEVLYLLNYSLNFFLYVISRRTFRKVLIEKMRWRCDWFEQWRLNEMRLDAALRSQQTSREINPQNGNGNGSTNIPHSDVHLLDNLSRDEYSSPTESAFFTSSIVSSKQQHNKKMPTKSQTNYSNNTVNKSLKKKLFKENLIDTKINQKTLSFYLLPQKLTNNLNAIQSTPTTKSIDFESNNKLLLDTNAQPSNLTLIEQKNIPFYIDNSVNIEPNHNDSKSIIKSSYRIPSPTILLPEEFSTSSKTITNSNMIINKIQRSTLIDSNRNLLLFSQPNIFHLNIHSIDNTEEFISNSNKISTSSINSLSSIQALSSPQLSLSPQQLPTFHFERSNMHKKGQDSILSVQQIFPMKKSSVKLPGLIDKTIHSNTYSPSPTISSSQMSNDIVNDFHSNPMSNISPDFESSPFQLFRKKIDNENIQFEFARENSSFETSSQTRIHHEIKHKPESLWKTKLTLKTLLSMANRDQAQALKDKKPIDYHMFLSNKLNKNSFFQYNDHIDTKFTANNKHTIIQQFNEQDYQETRKLYKRLLNTMILRKPINIKQPKTITSIKQIKTKYKNKIQSSNIGQENVLLSSNDSIQYLTNNEYEKPILITYQAVPVSKFNK